jgi:uncharacterized protein (DUF2062 family)
MASDSSSLPRGRSIRLGLRRYVHGLRTEGGTPRQEIAAIGAGVFIGCLPFYGFHLLICWAVGWLLGLNRVKMYLAANISNPFVAPWLLFAELQTGSWLRSGAFHEATFEHIKATGIAVITADLLIGSVAIGAALAALAAWGTHMTLRSSDRDRHFVELVRRAADRYAGMSITAWEFARGKLRNDPIYRATIEGGLLESGGTLVDVGCGQGLTLALLAEVRQQVRAGAWAGAADAPCFDRLVGVETRPRVAAMATTALAGEAEIVSADARQAELPRAHCVLLFDVLHLMPASDQETLLSALAMRVEPGGVMVIREADASAGWRFRAVRAGNRMKALAVGEWRQQFHFRSAAEWLTCFGRLGLSADVRPMGDGTPFANIMFRVTRRSDPDAQQRGTL